MTRSSKTSWLRSKFLARDFLPYLPTARLITLVILVSIPAIFAAYLGFGWTSLFIINGSIFLLSLLDLGILPQITNLSCQRILAEEIERGQDFQVRLLLTDLSSYPSSNLSSNPSPNPSPNPIFFRLIDSLPPSFADPFPLSGEMRGTLELTYTSRAEIRGDYVLDKLYFRCRSLLGLWEKQIIFALPSQIKVIPNMDSVRSAMVSLQKALSEQGFKVKKNRIGSGEFAQVRSYVVGDDPRKINWRQSAKLSELMTNVYEPEHGKHITILIDCGRVMGVELTQGNRLEKALEAAMTVSSTALKQGDYVSVLAFGKQVKIYIPPQKGISHLRTILGNIYNLQSEPWESNYAAAFHHLQTVQKRQSFLLIFSDVEPFLNSGFARYYIDRVKRKNPLLILGITDPSIQEWAKAEPQNSRKAMIISMAQKELLTKRREIRNLERLGINVLEVPEEELAAEAVSQYIEIINRGVL